MIKNIGFVIASTYLGCLVLLYVMQRNLLYMPTPVYAHPLPERDIISQDEKIKTIILNPGKPQAIIYFGGNAEPVIFNEVPFEQSLNDHTIYLGSL